MTNTKQFAKPDERDTPLHQRSDGRWEAWQYTQDLRLAGYCIAPDWICAILADGHPFEGIAWADLQTKPEHHTLASVLARCPWITEEAWERDRRLRIERRDKFHSDGHASEQEALACYASFLQDFECKEI
jgi:hypothetical protein